jgi:hypothetical protein
MVQGELKTTPFLDDFLAVWTRLSGFVAVEPQPLRDLESGFHHLLF